MKKGGVVYVYCGVCKKKILPLVRTWLDLEGIMLREIGQRKTKPIPFHLYV